MNKVRRAIIMAAGMGTRLRPMTLKTPKPLIPVRGKAMIETIIDALHSQGIQDISIVVGYLAKQFEYLTHMYSGISLVLNSNYASCNNISSLYAARELLDSSIMILDGDQIINNPQALTAEFEYSGYNSVWQDEHSDEWMQTVHDGFVTSCSRTGGNHGWQLYSISRWTSSDIQRLKRHLIYEFEVKHNTQIYWDDIAMFLYPRDFKLRIMPMSKNDVVEIDSLPELAAIDSAYERIF